MVIPVPIPEEAVRYAAICGRVSDDRTVFPLRVTMACEDEGGRVMAAWPSRRVRLDLAKTEAAHRRVNQLDTFNAEGTLQPEPAEMVNW